MSTCCSKNMNGYACDCVTEYSEETKVAMLDKATQKRLEVIEDEHAPSKCDNEGCFCHNWPKMNRHDKRKYRKTGKHDY